MIKSKLVDMKAKKVERDMQLALRIAILRDRVHWLIGFYGVMILANQLRVRRIKLRDPTASWSPLPLANFPYIATPFAFAYQADFAYGGKAERLHIEVQNILRNEKHWFNEPMVLPRNLQPHYRELMEECNAESSALGGKPEKDWATFADELSDKDALELSAPL